MTVKEIILTGTKYTQIDKIRANIRDSFVDVQNKLVTKKNADKEKPSSGETRLYIGSEVRVKQEHFFLDLTHSIEYYNRVREALPPNICFFSKENLLQYLCKARKEYFSPSQNYFYDININYQYNYDCLTILPQGYIPFTLFHHDGKEDQERFYVNSLDEIWTNFRKIALPVISYVDIYKMSDENQNIIYYFDLKLNEEHEMKIPNQLESSIVDNIKEDLSITKTERKALVNARNGQGRFKYNLIQTMNHCPFTQISERHLLRASHIKPWASSNNRERLDGYNGLLLTPTYDVLFDRGLISFNNDGMLLISPLLSENTKVKLGLIEGEVYEIANKEGIRNKYLEYHRDYIFKKTLGLQLD